MRVYETLKNVCMLRSISFLTLCISSVPYFLISVLNFNNIPQDMFQTSYRSDEIDEITSTLYKDNSNILFSGSKIKYVRIYKHKRVERNADLLSNFILYLNVLRKI